MTLSEKLLLKIANKPKEFYIYINDEELTEANPKTVQDVENIVNYIQDQSKEVEIKIYDKHKDLLEVIEPLTKQEETLHEYNIHMSFTLSSYDEFASKAFIENIENILRRSANDTYEIELDQVLITY